jgi:hypothetical protein
MNPIESLAMVKSVGGVSISVSHGGTHILPDWLAIIWTFVFAVLLLVFARHAMDTHGERRWWHLGHVLMAVGMIFIFGTASLDHLNIPHGAWSLLFAVASGVVIAGLLMRIFNGLSANGLWLVLAFNFAAIAYMWSPSGYVAPLTWILVAYFAVQAVLWLTDTYSRLDGRLTISGIGVNPDGTLTATAAEPLVCERDLRVSMGVMMLGMAYMLAAVQLLL